MNLLFVAVGGGLGSVLRYGFQAALGGSNGTLAVNLIGSFVIGFVAERYTDSQALRSFLITGILGGFTTFSAFSFEVTRMESLLKIAVYVAVSVLGSIGLCSLGIYLAQKIA